MSAPPCDGALPQLRGDLMLAITVHYTRLLMWFVGLPNVGVSMLNINLILIAWSLTEVSRACACARACVYMLYGPAGGGKLDT